MPIRKHLPNRIALTSAKLNYVDENHELAQAIDRELNFFEFTAIDINSGDLEEKMAKRMMSGVLVYFVNQVCDYIDYWRARDAETWLDVCSLYDRWKG